MLILTTISSTNLANNKGDKTPPWRTPLLNLNIFEKQLLNLTQRDAFREANLLNLKNI